MPKIAQMTEISVPVALGLIRKKIEEDRAKREELPFKEGDAVLLDTGAFGVVSHVDPEE